MASLPPDTLIASFDMIGASGFLLTFYFALRLHNLAGKDVLWPRLLLLAALFGVAWGVFSATEWLAIEPVLSDFLNQVLLAATMITLSLGLVLMSRFR